MTNINSLYLDMEARLPREEIDDDHSAIKEPPIDRWENEGGEVEPDTQITEPEK